MEKKYLKLAVLGIIVFAVLLGLLVVFFGGSNPPSSGPPADPNPHIVLNPYFVSQFLKANPDYKPPQPVVFSFEKIPTPQVSLSAQGFTVNELEAKGSLGLTIFNGSSKTFSFVVTSPAIDGSKYSGVQFAVAPGKATVLDLVILPYFNDIVEKSGAKAEKTEKGVLVFEVVCTANCVDGSNLLKVYANVP